jgi:hypothetical protein
MLDCVKISNKTDRLYLENIAYPLAGKFGVTAVTADIAVFCIITP